jgi:hypothetical protein
MVGYFPASPNTLLDMIIAVIHAQKQAYHQTCYNDQVQSVVTVLSNRCLQKHITT